VCNCIGRDSFTAGRQDQGRAAFIVFGSFFLKFFFLGPVTDYLQDFTDKSALAAGRTRAKVFFMKAFLRTLLAAEGPLFENGPMVQILEFMGADCQRTFARMIEQKDPGFQIIEIDLVANGFQVGIL
jgi:hypothetical protein